MSTAKPLTSWITSHCRAFLFAVGEFIRHPFASLLTILVIGIAMALPTLLFILQLNAKILSDSWNQNPNLSLYLKKSTSDEEISILTRNLKHNPAIAQVQYVSAEQGLQEFSSAVQMDNLLSKLGENPLPAVLIVTPATNYSDPNSLHTLANTLQNFPQVDAVQWDMDWISRFYVILSLVKRVTYFLTAALGAAVLLIIGNTIRLTTQTHQQEITLLKLMGANSAFIRRPLLYRGFMYGIFGGFIAWSLVLILFWNITPLLQTLFSSYHSHFSLKGFDAQMSLLIIGLCGLLGFIGSWLAAQRHILSDDAKTYAIPEF